MPKQVEFPDASVEEILRFCDTELLRLRAARKSSGNRIVMLGGGIMLVLVVALGALLLLFSMLRELPRHESGVGSVGFGESAAIVRIVPDSGHTLC